MSTTPNAIQEPTGTTTEITAGTKEIKDTLEQEEIQESLESRGSKENLEQKESKERLEQPSSALQSPDILLEVLFKNDHICNLYLADEAYIMPGGVLEALYGTRFLEVFLKNGESKLKRGTKNHHFISLWSLLKTDLKISDPRMVDSIFTPDPFAPTSTSTQDKSLSKSPKDDAIQKISREIAKPLKHIRIITDIPKDILQQIMLLLDPNDFAALSCASTQSFIASTENTLYFARFLKKNVYKGHFYIPEELLRPPFEQQRNNHLLRRWSRLIALQQWYKDEHDLFKESIKLPYYFEEDNEQEAWYKKETEWQKQHYLYFVANKKLPCGICNKVTTVAEHHKLEWTKDEGNPFMACMACQEQYLWTPTEAIILWGFTVTQLLSIPMWFGKEERLLIEEADQRNSTAYYCTSDLLEFRKRLPMMKSTAQYINDVLEEPIEIEISERLWHRSKNLPPEMNDYVTIHYKKEKTSKQITNKEPVSFFKKIVATIFQLKSSDISAQEVTNIRYFIRYNPSKFTHALKISATQQLDRYKQQSELRMPLMNIENIAKQLSKYPVQGSSGTLEAFKNLQQGPIRLPHFGFLNNVEDKRWVWHLLWMFDFATRITTRLARLHSENKAHGNLLTEIPMTELNLGPNHFFDKTFEQSPQYNSETESPANELINCDMIQLGKLISNLIKNPLLQMSQGHSPTMIEWWVTPLITLIEETLINPCLEPEKSEVHRVTAAQIAHRLLYWKLALAKFIETELSKNGHMDHPYHACHFVSVNGFQDLHKNLRPHFYSLLNDFSHVGTRNSKFNCIEVNKRINHQDIDLKFFETSTSISLGANCFLNAVITENPTAIISAFPIIKTFFRTYIIRLKTAMFPRNWDNPHEIETSKMIRILRTSDKESVLAFQNNKSNSATKKKRNETVLSIFCTDSLSNRHFWSNLFTYKCYPEAALHAWGISTWLVHKPEVRKNSAIPEVIDYHEQRHPWSDYRHCQGSFSPSKTKVAMGHNYLQGRCVNIELLPDDIFGKKACLVTIRLNEKINIDLVVWVLKDHIMDGRATFTEDRSLTIPVGTTLPEIGDLIFTEAWVQACAAPEQPAITWSAPGSSDPATMSISPSPLSTSTDSLNTSTAALSSSTAFQSTSTASPSTKDVPDPKEESQTKGEPHQEENTKDDSSAALIKKRRFQ